MNQLNEITDMPVGTMVRVTGNIHGHGFEIGEEVQLQRVDQVGNRRFVRPGPNPENRGWYMSKQEWEGGEG